MGTYARKTKIIFEIHNRRNLFLWRLYIIQALHLLDLNLIDALFLHYISDSVSLFSFVSLTIYEHCSAGESWFNARRR